MFFLHGDEGCRGEELHSLVNPRGGLRIILIRATRARHTCPHFIRYLGSVLRTAHAA